MKRIVALLLTAALCLFISAPFSVLADSEYPETAESASPADALPTAPTDLVTRAQAVYILIDGLGDEMKAVMPADLSVFGDYGDIDPMYYR